MTTSNDKPKSGIAALVMLTILMFMWGLANNMTGTMLQNFRHIIDMSDMQESVIRSAFHVAYLFTALPAVMYLYRHHSYRTCILLGLILYALGAMLFFPSASMESFFCYFVAIYVMATGCAVLETVANTYIVASAPTHDLGVLRLNLAQSFNPLGSVLGILLCQYLIIDSFDGSALTSNPEVVREELDTITMLYAGVGEFLLVLLVMTMFVSVPSLEKLMIGHHFKQLRQSVGRLMHNHGFVRGALALLVYVGAQTGVWGFTVATIREQGDEYNATFLYTCSMMAFAAARFLFTWLMKFVRYQKLLFYASLAALVLTLVVLFAKGLPVVSALIGISCCMSLMFATIFGIALEDTGGDMQTGGAILVMMIVGGALLMPLQNMLAKMLSAQMSYILPAVCFLGLVAYAAFVLLLDDKKNNV
jgi:FHS family L-fucose permease-like MFS transporter